MAPRANPLSPRLPGPLAAAAGLVRRARRRLGLILRGERRRVFFDIHDARLVNATLTAAGLPPITADPGEAEVDVAGAARFVLGLLASPRHLCPPRVLSDGVHGHFARWLLSDESRERLGLDLSPRAVENIRAAFEAGYRARADRLYELRDDVREAIPLALTPAQRGAYLEWCVAYGRHECDPLALLWSLFEHDEADDRGLVATYLVQPRWQRAVPHGLTRFGWDELKRWLAAEYGLRGAWFRRAALAPRYGPWDELALLLDAKPELARDFPHEAARAGKPGPVLGWLASRRLVAGRRWEGRLADQIRAGLPDRTGVNVIGLFRYPSGLQQAANVLVESLAAAGVRTELRDMPVRTTRDWRSRRGFDGLERFPVTVLNTGLDVTVDDAYRFAGLHRRDGVHRVAVWWWELSTIPPEWHDRGRDVDEVWAPTRFVADALRPLGKPVHLMPPSVELPAFDPLPKAAFGLDPQKFTFLFVFDMNSRMPRKNPLGLLRAFRLAFDRSEPVELAIKVSPQESFYPGWWKELRAATADAGVTLIDRAMSRGELLALMNAADAYVSLHRSEGFGLTMAEAMLLGKPTLATAYSGNLDFMTADNSFLIDHTLVPVDAPGVTAPPGAVWAEPSVAHAAAVMRSIAADPAAAAEKARRARAELREKLSHAAAGARMAARLRAIRSATGGGPA